MNTKTTRKRLLDIAAVIAMQNTDIRLAYNEKDDSTDTNKDAAHFLKYKEKRVGRDIELYAFMAKMSSDISALVDFLDEVIIPLNLHDSIAAYAIEVWGIELLPEEHWEEWKDLFKKGE